MFSRHHLSSQQETSALAAAVVGAALSWLPTPFRETLVLGEMAALFYLQTAELAAFPLERLTSRLALARRPPEAAWIKPQERSATDELR